MTCKTPRVAHSYLDAGGSHEGGSHAGGSHASTLECLYDSLLDIKFLFSQNKQILILISSMFLKCSEKHQTISISVIM